METPHTQHPLTQAVGTRLAHAPAKVVGDSASRQGFTLPQLTLWLFKQGSGVEHIGGRAYRMDTADADYAVCGHDSRVMREWYPDDSSTGQHTTVKAVQ